MIGKEVSHSQIICCREPIDFYFRQAEGSFLISTREGIDHMYISRFSLSGFGSCEAWATTLFFLTRAPWRFGYIIGNNYIMLSTTNTFTMTHDKPALYLYCARGVRI